jgi:hypothetical protein
VRPIENPLSFEEQAACFVVRDRNGQQLAYVYFEDEPAARLLTRTTRGGSRINNPPVLSCATLTVRS